MFVRKIPWFFVAIFLAGCGSSVVSATPEPAPEIREIGLSPSMQVFAPVFFNCALEQPGFQIITQEMGSDGEQHFAGDFLIHWGNVDEVSGYAGVIGEDYWIMVVHPNNPVESLTSQQVIEIYAGSIQTWSEVVPGSLGFDGEVQKWAYPSESDIENVFEEFLQIQTLKSQNIALAPNPAAMIQVISGNPVAIGFIPASWKTDSVKEVSIEDVSYASRQVPLVVLSSTEPTGKELKWLLCVQDAIADSNPVMP